MNLKALQGLITPVNQLIHCFGCDDPEQQKKIEELQAAMQKVKDLIDKMVK